MWKRKFEIDPINPFKSAFLQGKPIERDVYLNPPKEVHTKKIWKLHTTVYGLGDAPRA